jgi:hypothetical protein
MAGHDDGDYSFSDDDLDALPQNAFDELEHNAIQQTQASQFVKAPPSSDYGDDFDDDELDDAEVHDAANALRPRGGPAQTAQTVQPRSTTEGNGNKNKNRAHNDMKSITGRPLKKEWPSTNTPVINRPHPEVSHNVQAIGGQRGRPELPISSRPLEPPMARRSRGNASDPLISTGLQQQTAGITPIEHGHITLAAGFSAISPPTGSDAAKPATQGIHRLEAEDGPDPYQDAIILLQHQLEEVSGANMIICRNQLTKSYRHVNNKKHCGKN